MGELCQASNRRRLFDACPIADVQADEMIFEVDPDDISGSDASDSESEKSFCGSSIAVSSDVDSDPLDV